VIHGGCVSGCTGSLDQNLRGDLVGVFGSRLLSHPSRNINRYVRFLMSCMSAAHDAHPRPFLDALRKRRDHAVRIGEAGADLHPVSPRMPTVSSRRSALCSGPTTRTALPFTALTGRSCSAALSADEMWRLEHEGRFTAIRFGVSPFAHSGSCPCLGPGSSSLPLKGYNAPGIPPFSIRSIYLRGADAAH
jgi:hypothetical protein